MTDTTPAPLTADQLQEYREADLGEWYEGPWTQDYVEATGDDPAHNRVVHHETGTVLATLPDFAGSIALWIAVAREAHPKMLAEIDRLQSEIRSFADRLNEVESQFCQCQPVREHRDLLRPALYQHGAGCPANTP